MCTPRRLIHHGRRRTAADPRIARWIALLGSGSQGERAGAANGLANLANGNDAVKEEIRSQGGIKALVALVQEGGTKAQGKAAFALGNLAQDSAASQAAIAGAGGREVLAALARDGGEDAQDAARMALEHIPAGE